MYRKIPARGVEVTMYKIGDLPQGREDGAKRGKAARNSRALSFAAGPLADQCAHSPAPEVANLLRQAAERRRIAQRIRPTAQQQSKKLKNAGPGSTSPKQQSYDQHRSWRRESRGIAEDHAFNRHCNTADRQNTAAVPGQTMGGGGARNARLCF